jgi:hypothetical protein
MDLKKYVAESGRHRTGAPFYRGSGNARILGALLAVPPILTQCLSNLEKRSDLIASMRLTILSYKALHLR